MNIDEIRAGVDYVKTELRAIHEAAVAEDRDLTDDEKTRFDEGVAFVDAEEKRAADYEQRMRVIDSYGGGAPAPKPTYTAPNVNVNRAADVDFDALTRGALSEREVRDAALHAIEDGAKRYRTSPEGLGRAEQLARKGDGYARHIAVFAQDVYADAWAKHMTGRDYLLSDVEARALAVGTTTSAGSLVPTHLDPTIVLTNGGAYNPFRQIGRVVTLPTPGPNTWNGVTSAGVTASWDTEAAEVSDDSPETAQPSIPTFKGAAYVAASYEAIEDIAGLQGEVLMMFADAKDRLESVAFATGNGTGAPQGVITALDANTFVELDNTTAATLGIVDLHAAFNGLAARFRDRSTFVMSPTIKGTIEQLGTGLGGAVMNDIEAGYGGQLLGRPVALSSSFPGTPSSTTQVENWLVVGDFSNYVIVDKIGLRTVYNPVVVGGNQRPTGQAGWYAHFRTGAEVTYSGTATTNRAFVLLQDITSS